jgi:phage tail-like protein
MPISQDKISSYLQYLPAIFSEHPFLGRFLLAFEQVLTDLEGGELAPDSLTKLEEILLKKLTLIEQQGLEKTIANVAKLFDPTEIATLFDPNDKTLKDFLQWLADWTALSLRADWSVEKQRQFLAEIVSLYRYRGTRDNLIKLVTIFTGLAPTITEEDTPFQIGVHSTIGVDTRIGGSIPHYFRVTVTLPNPSPEALERQSQIVKALVDLQKPAHTSYDLEIVFGTMQINQRSTIGVDTLLGTLSSQN